MEVILLHIEHLIDISSVFIGKINESIHTEDVSGVIIWGIYVFEYTTRGFFASTEEVGGVISDN